MALYRSRANQALSMRQSIAGPSSPGQSPPVISSILVIPESAVMLLSSRLVNLQVSRQQTASHSRALNARPNSPD